MFSFDRSKFVTRRRFAYEVATTKERSLPRKEKDVHPETRPAASIAVAVLSNVVADWVSFLRA